MTIRIVRTAAADVRTSQLPELAEIRALQRRPRAGSLAVDGGKIALRLGPHEVATFTASR